ncbi:central kinetochore subunit Mis15/CHL4 [Blastomyces parvus]|uniref:Central kinetochore subunit Mis15/CHL4 n=1 Tax=Blastomyces parvus TaxID=2060905 RepID=A0A2B7X059_9EURO|nr:central kinetochore subunit Mis15/CHL4 [Blastomyces parvus]
MARRVAVRAPTAASLPDSLRIPSATFSLVKAFGKLSRSSLLDLVFQWLDDKCVKAFPPYLGPRSVANFEEDEEGFNAYPPAASVEELRGIYEELRGRKGGKREVIDRILEGDWRHGISLRQLAMVDMRYIEDHPVGQRWTALQLVPLKADSAESQSGGDISTTLPRFHASTFLRSIQHEISALVKAHYHTYRSKTLPLTFVRIFVVDSPYQQPRQSPYIFTDSSRIIYLAFPDSTPYIYSSQLSSPSPSGAKSTAATSGNALTTDTRTLRRLVNHAIPKALSRPQERYALKPTALTAKSLHTLLALRGPGRTNSANGAFTVFADAVVEGCPLDPRLPQSVALENYNTHTEHTSGYPEGGKENTPLPQQHSKSAASVPTTTIGKKKLPFQQSGGVITAVETMQLAKKRKLAVNSRFGTAGSQTIPPIVSTSSASLFTKQQKHDNMLQPPPSQPAPVPALDRLQIHLQDPPVPGGEDDYDDNDDIDTDDENYQTRPSTLTLTFSGSNVIAGLRQLAELGVVDPARMPSWMTGEEGVSVAVVKGGRRRREWGV